MEIFVWVVTGAIIGGGAQLLMPGPRAGGPAVAIAVCIVAAVFGGWLGNALSEPSTIEGFRPISRVSAAAMALFFMLALRSWAMRHETSRLTKPRK